MSQITFLIVITVSNLVGSGKGLLDCRNPPAETQAFFYVLEIQSLAVKYPDDIQTPIECSADSDCSNQICCEEEVGCCYSDTDNDRHICGCKVKTDVGCPRGAPVVYFRSYRCEDHYSSESSICLRKNKDGEIVEGSVQTSIQTLSRNEALGAVGQTTGNVADAPLGFFDSSHLTLNNNPIHDLVDGLPVSDLARMISTEKLYSLAEYVMDKHNKGVPYGRQHYNRSSF